MDLVVRSPRIPVPGETILGGDFLMVPGGKGANQAVAIAKLGAHVVFVTRLGDDVFGRKNLENLKRDGVDTRYVTLTPDTPSGVALITVDEAGNNAIVVAPGANAELSPDDVYRAQSEICSAWAVVAQLEVPLETVRCVAELAHYAGVKFILNPAPAQKLPEALLAMVTVLTPNETEAQILTGVEVVDAESACKAADRLMDTGVKSLILTMGSKGFLLAEGNKREWTGAEEVKVVDTTAAGDCFTGSLAVGFGQGHSLHDSAIFANRAAALCVTKMGAQPSMPTMEEVCEFVPTKAGVTRRIR
ncbi:MAG: ribokinase [Planctomycetes bacterium RBG_13_60_9]|nr:MAG: ribokinase [Planctomycetes bacterium RBG_13_60_9]